MDKALKGIRVIDLGHVLAAPTATMILADLGADVIRVEPLEGDDSREFGPYVGKIDKNHSAYYISLNRNKKSMALNLKHKKGKEILQKLIVASDVIIENFRPNTMKKLGFGWEEIHSINPRIIYASISGFGHDTLPEYSTRPAYDIIAQAYSGLMSITGTEDGTICKVGSSMGDIISGHYTVIGILTALIHRTRTGKGQYYDGSMVDSLFATLENAVVQYTVDNKIPEPLGTAHPNITPFQAFQTKDNSIVIPIGNDKLWANFCTSIGRIDLIQNPKFKTNHLRTTNRKELAVILADEIRKKTTNEWALMLEKDGLPFSPINNVKQICEDAHIKYRKMLVEVEQPGIGKVKIAGSPLHLSETPGQVYACAPSLGEHTNDILANILNLSSEEIIALKEEGVINK
jgi:CoA:oxalate CoA-transferase